MYFQQDVASLWVFLKNNNLKLPSGADDLINETLIFEVYNLQFIQVLCSQNFFNYSSYRLEDLVSKSHWELFSRPKQIQQQIQNSINKAISTIKPLETTDIKKHEIKELSGEKRTLEQDIKSIIPVIDQSGAVKYIIITHTLKASLAPVGSS